MILVIKINFFAKRKKILNFIDFSVIILTVLRYIWLIAHFEAKIMIISFFTYIF